MKLDKYDRRTKLRAKGIYPLPSPTIYKSTHKGETHYIFESEKALRAYASTIRIAGKGEDLWSHNGYYTDGDCHETLKPVIAVIGQAVFYGYLDTTGGSVVLVCDGRRENGVIEYRGGATTDARQAQLRDLARYADSMARHAAEKEREYQERWQQARQIETEIEERETTRQIHFERARQFVAELRELKDNATIIIPLATLFPNTVDRLTQEIRSNRYSAATLLFEIRDLKTKLSTEFANVL